MEQKAARKYDDEQNRMLRGVECRVLNSLSTTSTRHSIFLARQDSLYLFFVGINYIVDTRNLRSFFS
jgi:hypothetical protein